jgi:hypothetical protein
MIEPEPNCLWMARIASAIALFFFSCDMGPPRRRRSNPHAARNRAEPRTRASGIVRQPDERPLGGRTRALRERAREAADWRRAHRLPDGFGEIAWCAGAAAVATAIGAQHGLAITAEARKALGAP